MYRGETRMCLITLEPCAELWILRKPAMKMHQCVRTERVVFHRHRMRYYKCMINYSEDVRVHMERRLPTGALDM